MKQNKTTAFFVVLAMTAGFIGGIFCQHKPQAKENIIFKTGEILLPDYAHNDTLIVDNGSKLTEIYNLVNPESDGEISAVLSLYTSSYEGSYFDQFAKIKALRPAWDSLTIDQAIKED